jgi:hypothetical protein
MPPHVHFDVTKLDHRNVLFEYVRDRNNSRVGVVVAARLDPQQPPKIGCAFVNRKMGDVFDRGFGLHVALERARKERHVSVPERYLQFVYGFADRAGRYFREPCQLPAFASSVPS